MVGGHRRWSYLLTGEPPTLKVRKLGGKRKMGRIPILSSNQKLEEPFPCMPSFLRTGIFSYFEKANYQLKI